jgi:transcriptional regulator with XRE-family HTH domain
MDIHVGSRVRLRRTLCGLSQEKLGDAIGLTFQQVQKYERGANRISASRLFALSQVLDVPVSFFFDDVSDALAQGTPADAEDPRAAHDMSGDVMFKRETLELVRAYYRIVDEPTRRALYRLVMATANAESKKPERTNSKQAATV